MIFHTDSVFRHAGFLPLGSKVTSAADDYRNKQHQSFSKLSEPPRPSDTTISILGLRTRERQCATTEVDRRAFGPEYVEEAEAHISLRVAHGACIRLDAFTSRASL